MPNFFLLLAAFALVGALALAGFSFSPLRKAADPAVARKVLRGSALFCAVEAVPMALMGLSADRGWFAGNALHGLLFFSAMTVVAFGPLVGYRRWVRPITAELQRRRRPD